MRVYDSHVTAACCRRLMAETTAEFQAVNERMRALEARLAARLNRPDLAALLRAVQGGERDVLRFTLVLQARAPAYTAHPDPSPSLPEQSAMCSAPRMLQVRAVRAKRVAFL